MTATATTAPLRPSERKTLWERITNRWLVKLVIIAVVIIWIIPTLGVLISSFRPGGDVNATGWWTVFGNLGSNRWTLENYSQVLSSEGFGNAFLNSLSVTIPATVIPITIAAFAAYAFAWMEFPGRQWIFVSVVALLVVPLQMALIPLLSLFVTFDMNGTFPAIWLAHTGFGLPLAIYLLRNYIGSLPSSLMESARIDGATHFEIFTKLVVPLSSGWRSSAATARQTEGSRAGTMARMSGGPSGPLIRGARGWRRCACRDRRVVACREAFPQAGRARVWCGARRRSPAACPSRAAWVRGRCRPPGRRCPPSAPCPRAWRSGCGCRASS